MAGLATATPNPPKRPLPITACVFCMASFAGVDAYQLPCLHFSCEQCIHDGQENAALDKQPWVCGLCDLPLQEQLILRVPTALVVEPNDQPFETETLKHNKRKAEPMAGTMPLRKRVALTSDLGGNIINAAPEDDASNDLSPPTQPLDHDDDMLDLLSVPIQPFDHDDETTLVLANMNDAHACFCRTQSPSVMCTVHPGAERVLFCMDCKSFLCSFCHSDDHYEHHVQELTQAARDVSHMGRLREDSLHAASSAITSAVQNIYQTKNAIITASSSLKANINADFDSLIALLEKRRQDVLHTIQTTTDASIKILIMQADELEMTRTHMDQAAVTATSVANHFNLALTDPSYTQLDSHTRLHRLTEFMQAMLPIEKRTRDLISMRIHDQPLVLENLRFAIPKHEDIFSQPIDSVGLLYRLPRGGAPRDLFNITMPVRTIGIQGKGAGEFTNPICVRTLSNGNLMVVEFNGNRCQEITTTGTHVRTISTFTAGTFCKPWSVIVDDSDRIWVSDRGHDRIVVMNFNGTVERTISFRNPRNLALLPTGDIAITDGDTDQVKILSATTGAVVLEISKSGFHYGDLHGPRGLCATKMNEIIVTDSSNGRLQIFSALDGRHLRSISGINTGPSRMQQPVDVCLTNDGAHLLVVEYKTHCVSVWPLAGGKRLHTWGGEGNGQGQLSHPWSVCQLQDGSIVVCDTDNHRLQVF